jgi:TusA-related sulfurtransferase
MCIFSCGSIVMDALSLNIDQQLDACELTCPMPLLKTRQALRHMKAGELLKVTATDPGSWLDIPAYVGQSSHDMVHCQQLSQTYVFIIRVGEQPNA